MLDDAQYQKLERAYFAYHQALHQTILTNHHEKLSLIHEQVKQVMTSIYGEQAD